MALLCEGTTLHTGLGTSQGSPNAPKTCDACGEIESLSHILQSCVRTHNQRISRHNRIRDILAARLRKKEWSVIKEPTTRQLQE